MENSKSNLKAKEQSASTRGKKTGLIIGIIAALLVVFSISTYNSLVSAREEVKKTVNSMQTQYQRRSDLVPNLVKTVQGSASFEQATLKEVIDARANATSIKLDPSNLSPEQLNRFNYAQNTLGSSLSRLMAVAENYPSLKSTDAFRDLMSQLEGTENRISVARQDYGASAKDYNMKIQKFPTVILAKIFGFKEFPYFEANSTANPNVEFNFNQPSQDKQNKAE